MLGPVPGRAAPDQRAESPPVAAPAPRPASAAAGVARPARCRAAAPRASSRRPRSRHRRHRARRPSRRTAPAPRAPSPLLELTLSTVTAFDSSPDRSGGESRCGPPTVVCVAMNTTDTVAPSSRPSLQVAGASNALSSFPERRVSPTFPGADAARERPELDGLRRPQWEIGVLSSSYLPVGNVSSLIAQGPRQAPLASRR